MRLGKAYLCQHRKYKIVRMIAWFGNGKSSMGGRNLYIEFALPEGRLVASLKNIDLQDHLVGFDETKMVVDLFDGNNLLLRIG